MHYSDWRERISQHQNVILFGVSSVFCMMMAAWLSFGFGYVPGDALSRTYSAMAVFHSRYPHLAAIGFIWPPLTAIAQLPLVLIKVFAYNGFSGGIISALSAGALLTVINHYLQKARFTWRWRISFLAFVGLNPLWIVYAINGMSEMPFLLVFVLASLLFLDWLKDFSWRKLSLAGILTAVMFGFRYDAVVFVAVAALGILVSQIVYQGRQAAAKIEANMIIYLMPPIYAAFLWLFANWVIMGDALYFLRSSYSNAFLVSGFAGDLALQAIQGSPLLALYYFWLHLILISPLLFVLIIVSIIWGLFRRRVDLFALLLILLSPTLFQFFMYLRGQSFGLLRFYLSFQAAGVVLAVFLVNAISKRHQLVFRAAIILFLLLGMITSLVAMNPPENIAFFPLRPDSATIAFAQKITRGKPESEYKFALDFGGLPLGCC